MTPKSYIPDSRRESAPPLPTTRPATRAETWAHYHHVWFDRKGHAKQALCTDECLHERAGELETYCRDAWAWSYIQRFLSGGWDKHPDWVEGEPVIPEAVPPIEPFPFPAGNMHACIQVVYQLFETANQMKRSAA